MKKFYCIIIVLLSMMTFSLFAQMHMDLQDNIDVESNSWIIFNPAHYNITDAGNDGLIRINNKENIILEGPGVSVDGSGYTGFFVKIQNSQNIIIRNFDSVYHFKYAVYITTADSIQIFNCNFSYNKVDSSGWIDVWSNYGSALGGGVMMYQVNHGDLHNNVMNMQNDGVALYHCDNINVANNDFNWNTSFGIRMFFTDSCHINDNLAAHINRPYTNPSDCAAILLIVSNANMVDHNDFSNSGDGIFLGQYQYSEIPNNNVFLYNECSYSPHNAIEATFADGNIYKHNNCNYSHYGFWLGYSFNALVDSNEVIGNQHSGIAIDRGFNNTITNNDINQNPIGIELWEGDPISGYEDQLSQDYTISNNIFEGNRLAIYAGNTEHMVMKNDSVRYNNNGIQILDDATDDTISYNDFKNNTFYHIDNQSPYDIYAQDNSFFTTDTSYIDCNIYDKKDNLAKGTVMYQPYTVSGTPVFSGDFKDDFCESPAVWYAYPEVCGWWDSVYATTVRYDSLDKVMGAASVFCGTGNGWDIGLEYHAAGDTVASWNLTDLDTMIFWVKTNNQNQYQFQYHSLEIGNYCGGYFKFSGSATYLNNTQGVWTKFTVPLGGGGSPYYVRTQMGDVSLDNINYFALHADTWDVGWELWLDGFHFGLFGTGEKDSPQNTFRVMVLPNPVRTNATLSWEAGQQGIINIGIHDIEGQRLYFKENVTSNKGQNYLQIPTDRLSGGLYYVRIYSVAGTSVCKMIVMN